jgi:hypothetical protein
VSADTVRQQTTFAIIPLWIILKGSARAVQVYGLLAGRYSSSERGGTYPSHATLAADLTVSTDVIGRAVDELRTIGAIVTTRRTRPDGSLAGLDYELIHLKRKNAVQGQSRENADTTSCDLDRKNAVQGTTQNRTNAVGVAAKMRSHDPDQVHPDKTHTDADAIDAWRVRWKTKYGHDTTLIVDSITTSDVGSQMRALGFDAWCAALDGFFASDHEYAARVRHALKVFAKDPNRWRATPKPIVPRSGTDRRQQTRNANAEHVADGRLARQLADEYPEQFKS